MIRTHTVITITPEDLEWAKDAVAFAKLTFPGFCGEGVSFGCDKQRRPFEDSALTQVVVCKHWLETREPVYGRCRRTSSYFLKHVVEEWAGFYVSNAAFIAAACALDFNQKQADHDSPVTLVGISKDSLPKPEDRKRRFIDEVIIEAP
jgi:hypothetical protein